MTNGIVNKEADYKISFGNTLYVGGTGEGNYTKIQDAIDNASDGNTIFVFGKSSPYYESVVIYKSINLVGENQDITMIDVKKAFDNVIRIKADWVNISNFTIMNSSHHVDSNAGVHIDSNHNKIMNNNICLNGVNGIYFSYLSSCNVIKNNNIFSNKFGIFTETPGDNNTIELNNIFSNHFQGILFYGSCNNFFISFNNISNNSDGARIYGNNNIIFGNNFEKNYDDYGLVITGEKNIIEKNNFIKNKKNVLENPLFSKNNFWDSNYWDDWIGIKYDIPIFQMFPKIIYRRFLRFIIDWHPAKEPYDI